MNFLQWWSAGSTTTNGGLVVLVLLMQGVRALVTKMLSKVGT